MEDSVPPVAAGTLSGVNLSGEPEDATLPEDDERTAPAPEPEPEEAPEEEAPEPEAEPDETPEEPAASRNGAAQTEKKTGAPSRTYVVLEQGEFDDASHYFTEVHRVEARNAQNAMRKAFKDLHGEKEAEATLVVVPASMWRPEKVRIKKTERVSVSFG